ncbi:Flavin mononucleotide phosphatase YigB [compost metagenome]
MIADSGALGIEKPDPRIFQFAAERMNVATSEIVHIGDSWEADIVGAIAANARAIWFRPNEQRDLSSDIRSAVDASEVRAALRDFGVASG